MNIIQKKEKPPAFRGKSLSSVKEKSRKGKKSVIGDTTRWGGEKSHFCMGRYQFFNPRRSERRKGGRRFIHQSLTGKKGSAIQSR